MINRLTYLAAGEPGYLLDPRCTMLREGFLGGYQFELIQTLGDGGLQRYKEVPAKNMFSHIHDANQYLCLALQPETRAQSEAVQKNIARMQQLNRMRARNRTGLE